MASAAQIESLPAVKARELWKLGDAAVVLVYSSVVLWTLQYHEKWADEAQAWLIARDLDLKTIWFHELRYEGTPGLWHTILWIAQHVFHAKYGALGYIGAVFAIAGAAALLFLAPFPRYIRWPLAFTYVMVYQYALISRPYTLFPLLAFLAAYFYKDVAKPERISLVLAILALLTLHGTILAGCLGLTYLIQGLQMWPVLDVTVKRRYFVCIAGLTLLFLFIVLIMKPTPDVAEFAMKEKVNQLGHVFQQAQPTTLRKTGAVISGAFLDYTVPSAAFILLAFAWCAYRRKPLEFALPVSSLVVFYALIHGYPHHHGTVFVAAITAIWIAWLTNDPPLARIVGENWPHIGITALLLVLCTVNLFDAAVVIHREYLYPYSGSEDAAKFLKNVGADRQPLFGLLYGVAAIQAYFDHNILTNLHTAYFHHGLPDEEAGTTLNLSELHRVDPEYIVVYSDEPELMMQLGAPYLFNEGYRIVHFSDGYYLYKRAVYQRDTYFIFQKPRAGQGSDTGFMPLPEPAGNEEAP